MDVEEGGWQSPDALVGGRCWCLWCPPGRRAPLIDLWPRTMRPENCRGSPPPGTPDHKQTRSQKPTLRPPTRERTQPIAGWRGNGHGKKPFKHNIETLGHKTVAADWICRQGWRNWSLLTILQPGRRQLPNLCKSSHALLRHSSHLQRARKSPSHYTIPSWYFHSSQINVWNSRSGRFIPRQHIRGGTDAPKLIWQKTCSNSIPSGKVGSRISLFSWFKSEFGW